MRSNIRTPEPAFLTMTLDGAAMAIPVPKADTQLLVFFQPREQAPEGRI
jgi:hypothetical protein